MKTVPLAALALLAHVAALSPAAVAASDGPGWLRLRVTDPAGAESVSVNLPLSVAEVVLGSEAAQERIAAMRRERGELSVQDLRRAWRELREAGPTEVITIEKPGELVRVALTGDAVEVRVSAHEGHDEEVQVEVPASVVDALLQGEGDELDVLGALRALRETGAGELVRVTDGEQLVRIWID